MKIETIQLSNEDEVSLTLYLHEEECPGRKPTPLIMVIPGGGYEGIAFHEGEPVALKFYEEGYQAAVLKYSVKEKARNYRPMIEGYQAIKQIREHANEWWVNSEQILVCGFSAGAHLAASLGVMWKKPEIESAMECGDRRYQPNGMILCYPVITSGLEAHRGSFAQLTGSWEDDEINEQFSIDKLIDDQTPPVFIWHTTDDEIVPIQNTIVLEQALSAHRISFEAHVFRSGRHGLGLCDGQWENLVPHCGHWVELCKEWIREEFEV